jgi:lipopolysaccharide export LptBFGC system permease protein LptF
MGDPSYIRDLNVFIEELNKVKVNNPHTNDIYQNIVKDFNNTMKDVRISRGLDDLGELLNLPELSSKERREHRRQNEINRYYQKKYERQIVILQKIVIFFCLAILGTLFPDNIKPLYLGLLFAIGFVVIFYDMWDVFLRDSRDFDQYNFNYFYMKPFDDDKSYLNIDLTDDDTKYCE